MESYHQECFNDFIFILYFLHLYIYKWGSNSVNEPNLYNSEPLFDDMLQFKLTNSNLD